jgi:hypothetical protein
MKGKQTMKKQNIVLITVLSTLAAVTEAAPNPGGIVTHEPAPAGLASTSPEAVGFPVITIHSAGNILRGKTGSFVLARLATTPALAASGISGTYVNFKVSGTAVAGVDYLPFISPTYIGQSGFGVISVKTLADPRGASNGQSYSVVVTLEPGPGYAVGQPNSAKLLISTSCVLQACW